MNEPLPPLDDELDAMLAPGRVAPPISPLRRAAVLAATLEKVGNGPGGSGGRLSFGAAGLVIGIFIGGAAMWAWNAAHDGTGHHEDPSVVSGEPTPGPDTDDGPTEPRAPGMLENEAPLPRREAPATAPRVDTARMEHPRDHPGRVPENDVPENDVRESDEHPEEDSLSAERRIIDAALAQVSSGHAATALQAVARHEALFPAGQLAEAREVVRVRSLAQLGRMDEARASLAALEERFPGNRVATPLRTLISEPPPSREH